MAPLEGSNLDLLRERLGSDAVDFARFMEVALYDPQIGYYRSARARIGRRPEADFTTASDSSPLFGRLVAAACESILGPNAARFTWVEIGAEPGRGVLGPGHGFAASKVARLGDPIDLAGPCIVFSNELFDAQPFRRFQFREGRWREMGVRVEIDRLREVEIEGPIPAELPSEAAEGYRIDAPIAAVRLLERICAQPWTGLFVAFDYGKPWTQIAHHTPQGTARAYRRHAQSPRLLDNPGEQDLTCHVCWDWLADALERCGFGKPVLESQEGFLTRHAGSLIERTIETRAASFSRDKLSLLQLLHPANMGQSFQVLHAVRPPGPRLPLLTADADR
jgi:SAM-dependent MidA family methyltransferase